MLHSLLSSSEHVCKSESSPRGVLIPTLIRLILVSTSWLIMRTKGVLEVCRVVTVKRLPIHLYSSDYIFWSFGIAEFILVI